MKLAIISDVHADVHALQDALAQIERLGCDEVVCAGDVIDYGLFPEETIALLREKCIPTIRGNHDRWGSSRTDTGGWDLSPGAMAFLAALPVSWTRTIEGVRVAVHHARPGNDMHGVYPDASSTELASLLGRAEADVLIVGHTHIAFARYAVDRLVCNPGALLRSPAQPMGEATLLGDAPSFTPSYGTFGILELPARSWRVFRVTDGVEVEVP